MSEIVLAGEGQRNYALHMIGNLDLTKKWVVVVKPFVKKRTNPQLSLYWKWLGIIANETGNDKDDLHDYFKVKFLSPELVSIFGMEQMRYTTSGLPAKEMSEYMDRVLAFTTSELGVFLPLPQDQLERA